MEVVSGGNWSCKTCDLTPVKSLPPTNRHLPLYRPDVLPVGQLNSVCKALDGKIYPPPWQMQKTRIQSHSLTLYYDKRKRCTTDDGEVKTHSKVKNTRWIKIISNGYKHLATKSINYSCDATRLISSKRSDALIQK